MSSWQGYGSPLNYAAEHGFSDDGGSYDSPQSDQRPSYALCAAFYAENRAKLVGQFLDAMELEHSKSWGGVGLWCSWPVSVFERDNRLRALAERKVAEHKKRRKAFARKYLVDPDLVHEVPTRRPRGATTEGTQT